MSTTTIRRRPLTRVLATTTAAGVAAAGFALLPSAPAQAAPLLETDDATLSWGFSGYAEKWAIETEGAVSAISPTEQATMSGGTYSAASGFELSGGTGTIAADGTGEIGFTGSVTYNPFGQYAGMTSPSYVTFADFELDIESADRGSLSALVSYDKPNYDLVPTRATVAAFDIESLSVTDGVLELETAAPDWAGAVEEGTYAPGYSDAWPTDLVDLMLTDVEDGQDTSVYFYRTSASATNDSKAPEPIVASASVAEVAPSVEVSSSVANNTVTVDVAGTGFTAVTNPGDAGVYVGLAEAGGLPDTDSQEDQDAFVASAWIMPAQMADGTFTTALSAAKAKLDPRKDYAVYTWQAHSHSNTTQDTETAVDIDWKALGYPQKSTTAAKVKAPTSKKAGKVAVTVKGDRFTPTGKVKVTYKAKGKKAKSWTRSLRKGKAAVKLPRSRKGQARLVVTYLGDDAFKRSAVKRTIRIKR